MRYIVVMDIARLKEAKGKAFRRQLNGKVRSYIDPTIVRSDGEKASHVISQAMLEGKGLQVDLAALQSATAPKEIGAGRGRKSSEVSFSEDFDIDELVLNEDLRAYAQRNTIRLTLNAESFGIFVDGSTKQPTKTAARHLVKYVRNELGFNISVRPDKDGVKFLDIKLRDEWSEDDSDESDEDSDTDS